MKPLAKNAKPIREKLWLSFDRDDLHEANTDEPLDELTGDDLNETFGDSLGDLLGDGSLGGNNR